LISLTERCDLVLPQVWRNRVGVCVGLCVCCVCVCVCVRVCVHVHVRMCVYMYNRVIVLACVPVCSYAIVCVLMSAHSFGRSMSSVCLHLSLKPVAYQPLLIAQQPFLIA
jgi:hypothetical protein